jgi:hypothetical protein
MPAYLNHKIPFLAHSSKVSIFLAKWKRTAIIKVEIEVMIGKAYGY